MTNASREVAEKRDGRPCKRTFLRMEFLVRRVAACLRARGRLDPALGGGGISAQPAVLSA